MKTNTLTPELLHKIDAYWRAANYLSVAQIYLFDNPLLKRPLTLPATARFTKTANSVIRSAIRSGPCSTIPISSWPAASATAKRKPLLWRRHGSPTSFSIR